MNRTVIFAENRKPTEKIFIFLLCAVALVMPWHKVLPSPLLSLAAILAIVDGSPKLKWNRLRYSPHAFLFASLYFITLYSFLISDNTTVATRDLQLKISIALIPLLVTAYIEFHRREIRLILGCFVISCIAFALFALGKATVDYFTSGATHFFYEELVQFTFIHPSYIAMFMVFAVTLLLFRVCTRWNQLSAYLKWIYLVILVFLSFFVFLLTSKMAMLSLFILVNCIVYLYLQRQSGKLKTFLVVLAFNLTGFLLILALPTTRERVMMLFKYNEVNYSNSVNSREEIWKAAVEVAGRNFLGGVGSGDADTVLADEYLANGWNFGFENRYNAHSQYFQTLIEGGVFSLLFLLAVFAWSLRSGLKRKNYPYLAFLLLYLINMTTESMMKTQSGVMFYAFFNVLMFVFETESDRALTKP